MDIITKFNSPNFDSRTTKPDMLVLHYTDMISSEEAINKLCDIEAKVSAHYLVSEQGETYQLVLEDKRAWHAGQSYWRGREKINDYSIGIEIANPGHSCGYKKFPLIQMQSVIYLSKQIMSRHNIASYNIVAHSDIAPLRKKDPGELFDWRLLAENDIGIYHEEPPLPNNVIYKLGDAGGEILLLQGALAKIGYKIDLTGSFDYQTAMVIVAFKRRFHQHNLDQNWDELCQRILNSIQQYF
jgi:N-acetylmuramoyl-L-alanine amidase